MNDVGKKALKAGMWYTVCTFILKGISFITMPLFTRLMSVSDVGLYANLTSWITILSGIATLDLYNSVNLAHFEYKGKISEYMSSIAIAGSIYTVILYAVAYYFRNEIILLLGINDYMFHIMFAYFMVNPAVSILHAKFRIYLQYKQTIITSLIPTGCSVIASLLFVIILKDNRLEARVFGYYGVWMAFAITIYAYIIYKGKKFDFRYVRFALPISIPLIVHTLANTLLSTSDRVMINKMRGSEETALYSVAYSCAMVISILWSSINQAWAPWCYDMMNKRKENEIRKVAKPILIIFSLLVVAGIFVAPEILLLMGGEKYLESIYVIPPVMLGFVAQMLYTLYVNIEYFNKKQKQIMLGTLIAAIFNIVLNYIFIPIFGYVAAAYTTLAGYILLLLIHYLFVRKMGKHSIYDMKFNIILLVSAIIIGISSTLLYQVPIIRWSIVAVAFAYIAIVFVRNRKELVPALKNKDMARVLNILHLE